MPEIFDYFVPWLKGQKMYFSPHIDLAWLWPWMESVEQVRAAVADTPAAKQSLWWW